MKMKNAELAQEARLRTATLLRNNKTPHIKPGGLRSELVDGTGRPKISAPVKLLHSTKDFSYNTPDPSGPSSPVHTSSNTENGFDGTPGNLLSSAATGSDVSFSGRARSPLNHLSSYFGEHYHGSDELPLTTPLISQRPPSHAKSASMDMMIGQRSTRRRLNRTRRSMLRHSVSAPSSTSTMPHGSGGSHSSCSISDPIPTVPTVAPPSPHHLAQVNEMAGDTGFSGGDTIEEEEQDLISLGLRKLSVDVYLHDVELLSAKFFHE